MPLLHVKAEGGQKIIAKKEDPLRFPRNFPGISYILLCFMLKFFLNILKIFISGSVFNIMTESIAEFEESVSFNSRKSKLFLLLSTLSSHLGFIRMSLFKLGPSAL